MFRQVRGMRDLFGETIDRYEYLIEKAKKVAHIHGFSLIETPILEYTDVFLRSLGEESDVVSKEMYSFEDMSGDSVTLRPEGTASVLRAIATEKLGNSMPMKLMYYGPMFRYDRPQKGRYRQFHQIGFEYLGDLSPYTDASVILAASDILCEVGICNFEIIVNSLGDVKTRESYSAAIVKYFSRHISELSENSQRRLKTNPMRILDSKDEKDIEIVSMAPLLRDYITKDAGIFFAKVCDILEDYGANYRIDDFLVRGLDYYSHTTFEIKILNKDVGGAIGGGGRYDTLLKEFGGPDVSGVGFALGAERLMDIMKFPVKEEKKIAVVSISNEDDDSAFDIMRMLHENGIQAEFIHGETIQKKLRGADKRGCYIAVILGKMEKEEYSVTVKLLREQAELKSFLIKRQMLIPFLRSNM